MKKVLFMIVVAIGIQQQMYGQNYDCNLCPGPTGTVYTPNNTPVKTCEMYPEGWFIQAADDESKSDALEVHECENAYYNCHTFAWYLGSTSWICKDEVVSTFLVDGSYEFYDISTKPYIEGLRVLYNSDNHSAITTSTPDI